MSVAVDCDYEARRGDSDHRDRDYELERGAERYRRTYNVSLRVIISLHH